MANLAQYPPWTGDGSDELGRLSQINDELWVRFNFARQWVLDATGIRCTVVSGYRSSARQAQLYACYRNRDPRTGRCRGNCTSCNLAAPPGQSNHERGLAIDMAPNYDANSQIRPIFAACGLYFPIAVEHWHVEMMPNRQPLPGPAPAPPPPEDIVSDLSIVTTTAKHEVEIRGDGPGRGAFIRWVEKGGLVTANSQWAVLFGSGGGLLPQPPSAFDDMKPVFFQGRLHVRLWKQGGIACIAGVNNMNDDLTRWDPTWYPA